MFHFKVHLNISHIDLAYLKDNSGVSGRIWSVCVCVRVCVCVCTCTYMDSLAEWETENVGKAMLKGFLKD